MSKYSEVIKQQKEVIASWEIALNRIGIDVYDDRKYILKNIEYNRLRLEALEIADRLEQADVAKCEDDYYNYDDSEYGQGYENGFQHGYNAALADVRGDNDD